MIATPATGTNAATASRPELQPDLSFAVVDAQPVAHAAAPTLSLRLQIEDASGLSIRSILLNAQVRIAVARRPYKPETRERLVELFGRPEQWAQAARSLLWTQTVVLVPPFSDRTEVDVPIACTYDFEVSATAKYLHALQDGHVPLELLFSGTVLYAGDDGLRTCLIPWDREAGYALPVTAWKAVMDHYFPNAAWLRLQRDVFDRLYAFKAQRALPTWEAALDALLARPDGPGA